jgi:hypothetical protein
MKARTKRKSRRAGATLTFSISVDPETKRALRTMADERFGGNLSALITDFAAEAKRRLAAGEVLRHLGIRPFTPAEARAASAQIEREVAAIRARNARRRRRAA